ncbi:MAG: glycosyltransferase [Sphingomonadales bacterium]|nr:glycosyltransferase [Sphingomonadales bacterium]
MTPTLILFARYPAAGTCKTRLIPALGAEGAADLHRRMTERTIGILRSSGLPVIVAYTGAGRQDFERWLGADVGLEEQVAGDLTDRLLAFTHHAPLIFFGADTPDLQARHIAQAVDGLQNYEVVIGPAEDGGYYLIGITRPIPKLFTNMPWSSEQVLPETLTRLADMGIAPLLLETLADCDRPEDLARWPEFTL